ncbi:sporulation protein Cse60 [Paenibacillus oryzisoli]|uniref:sporulation protein Cse60 n=1 Tax=Paenibacillus oryzisoli TaxID=1850517 RepID=UPI003D2795CA
MAYKVQGFINKNFMNLSEEIDEFVAELADGKLIDIKYNSVPTTISTNAENGVYPDQNYTALVIYKK